MVNAKDNRAKDNKYKKNITNDALANNEDYYKKVLANDEVKDDHTNVSLYGGQLVAW